MKLTRADRALRAATPCSSVLNQVASASSNPSASRDVRVDLARLLRPVVALAAAMSTRLARRIRARGGGRCECWLWEQRPKARPAFYLSSKSSSCLLLVLIVFVFDFGFQRGHQVGHFDGARAQSRPLSDARSSACSSVSVVSTPLAIGMPVSSDYTADGRGAFIADDFEMIGFAAYDRAQRDQRVEFAGLAICASVTPISSAPGTVTTMMSRSSTPSLPSSSRQDLEFRLPDVLVETSTDYADMQTFAVQIGSKGIWVHESVCPVMGWRVGSSYRNPSWSGKTRSC